MNRKIIFTCLFVLMLAMILSSCKLPASGPPAVTTQQPIVPTATQGVLVVPTSTSLPPTPIVVTSTSAPPTPVPPTATPTATVSPTSVLATLTPLPVASRIQFAPGGTGTVFEGEIDTGQTIYYVLQASASQTMDLKVSSPNGDVILGVFGADRKELLSKGAQATIWSGTLPTTQDYYISLTALDGQTDFSLSISIPPLVAAPTANLTPVAGSFNPVATYGQPTFEDNMKGENIEDWVNPSTGLLPDTKYINISETGEKFYVTGKVLDFNTWYFTWRELADFYLQATFNSGTCAEKDAYGLIIRGPAHLAGVSFGYVVTFSCDGSVWVFRLDSASPYAAEDLVSWTHSDYIQAGSNQTNVMGIQAIGNKLTVYANGHQIAQVTDSHYTSGRYGVFVSADVTANYTYQVIQMSYWDLTP